MGEANNRKPDIEAIKQKAALEAQQRATMAHMLKEPGIFVNGFSLFMVGGMIRFAVVEMSSAGAEPNVRGGFVMHPQDFEQLMKGGAQLLEALKSQQAAGNENSAPKESELDYDPNLPVSGPDA